MATDVSVPNNFTAGTPSVADDVDANFAAVVTWINANAVHLDASKAFTSVPSGPATDPTSDNQLARKLYVDNKVAAGPRGVMARNSATSATANAGTTGVLSAPAFTAVAGRRYRITISAYGATIVGAGTTEWQIRRGGGAVTVGAAYVGATAGVHQMGTFVVEDVPGAGSVTYVFYTFTNATTVQINTSASAPFQIIVEDIGAS